MSWLRTDIYVIYLLYLLMDHASETIKHEIKKQKKVDLFLL